MLSQTKVRYAALAVVVCMAGYYATPASRTSQAFVPGEKTFVVRNELYTQCGIDFHAGSQGPDSGHKLDCVSFFTDHFDDPATERDCGSVESKETDADLIKLAHCVVKHWRHRALDGVPYGDAPAVQKYIDQNVPHP
jgi:hypothetical protein